MEKMVLKQLHHSAQRLMLVLVVALILFVSVKSFSFSTTSSSSISNIHGRNRSLGTNHFRSIEKSKQSASSLFLFLPDPAEALSAASNSIRGIASNLPHPSVYMSNKEAENFAGPFFGLSLFPYIAFIYFLNVKENDTPKGVTVGFATCLLFVFLTIPAAIAAQVLYGVSLADSDWLHGSAESLLTITNLITVLAFRQALEGKEKELENDLPSGSIMPPSSTSYRPMTTLVVGLSSLAVLTALVPALAGADIHTPYLNGFMDLPPQIVTFGSHVEPANALTVATWIIHISSLIEFLVAMGFAWRWADVVGNPTWKGLTWALIPLHSSGIAACTYHLFYNRIPFLVPLQAFLTCVGNITAAYAGFRIAKSNGWTPPPSLSFLKFLDDEHLSTMKPANEIRKESDSLVGFEDLGDALANDTDISFLFKLFAGCAIASYTIKYGELFLDFPFEANPYLALYIILMPSLLNAFKWYKRSQDPSFEGWF